MSEKIKHFYEFEGFRLDAENLSLWRNDRPVSISPKSLEILTLLLKRNGEIVSRDELLDTVWKDTFVEEGNINYTVSLLRKTLGKKDLIQTVPRRGYRFVGEARETSQNGKVFPPTLPTKPSGVWERRPVLWFLAITCLLSLTFLASFAYWPGRDISAQPSGSTQSENVGAMQAYTRGRVIMEDRDTKNRYEKAIDEFQKSITLDPTLARGYVGLAEGFTQKGVSKSNESGLENYARARAAVQKALALDQNLADAY